jgi:hypothetical protein
MQPVLLYEENECKAVDSGMPKELTCLDHISADKQKASCSGADHFFFFRRHIGKKSSYNDVQCFQNTISTFNATSQTFYIRELH